MVQVDIEKVLTGLGFEREDMTRSLTEFSSGWQMRVEIAKILLQRPNLVLLDEPTNHLDIESIQWLEEFLANYPGAVVLVSHDRAFLDNVTQRTIEISLGKVYDYKANYSGYVEMREERLESQLATHSNQQRQIRQIERFVERFRYKSTKSRSTWWRSTRWTNPGSTSGFRRRHTRGSSSWRPAISPRIIRRKGSLIRSIFLLSGTTGSLSWGRTGRGRPPWQRSLPQASNTRVN
jgi:ATPase subunit of ABC transporter with duplicated ATPase domains